MRQGGGTHREIVDPTGQRQRRLRRQLRRLLLPIAGVTLVIASMVGIGLHTTRIVQARSERLTHDLLTATQTAVAGEVARYLEPATDGGRIAHDMLRHRALQDRSNPFVLYAGATLRQVPQVQAFMLANSDGDFELLQRQGDRGVEQDIVTSQTGARLRTVIHSDANGDVTDQAAPVASTYDPRRQPFYSGALATGSGAWWSDPTLVGPSRDPVITAAVAYENGDDRHHVMAVNISLDRLSAFLAKLQIGRNGVAVIARRDGRIIAAPARVLAGAAAGSLDPAAAHGVPASLVRAFDVFRVEGFGSRRFTVAQESYLTMAVKLPTGGPDWVLLVVAPAADFATFTTANSRSLLAWSLVTVGLAAVLAGLLVHQSTRRDRLLAAIARRDEHAALDRRALRALLGEPGLLDPDAETPALTEQLAALAEAERVGLWRLAPDGTLQCEDLFDRADGGHLAGLELSPDPADRTGFVHALADAAAADAMPEIADPARDPRTARLHRLHLRSARPLTILPLGDGGDLAGAITLESARRAAEARPALELVASIAALRFRARTSEAGAPMSPDGGPAPEPQIPRGHSLYVAPTDAPPPEGLFPAVAVMVMAFGTSTATKGGDEVRDTIGMVSDITRGLAAIAQREKLFLVRIAGHRLMAVAGCTAEPDPGAPVRLAEAALALRDLVVSALAAADIEPVFQIGIDVGRALGAAMGAIDGEGAEAPGVFNLWGDAVTGAERMAQSNHLPGAIQVTEAAHGWLRDHFLFRSRGHFYDPRSGLRRTYVLAGHR